ncbi:MAG: hypothetical protein AB7V43_15415 [Acidimicrobiia bacterium]
MRSTLVRTIGKIVLGLGGVAAAFALHNAQRNLAIDTARMQTPHYRGPGACSLLPQQDLAALTPAGFTMLPGQESDLSDTASTTINGRRGRSQSVEFDVRAGSECTIALQAPDGTAAVLQLRAAITYDRAWLGLATSEGATTEVVTEGIDPAVNAALVNATIDGSKLCSVSMTWKTFENERVTVTSMGLEGCDLVRAVAAPLSFGVR